MGNDLVNRAAWRLPRRYRLGPRQFEFRLIDEKIIETNTGLVAVLPRGGLTIGQQPPTASPETRDRVYLTDDGVPADERSQFLLERGMTNYLCVLLCRVCPEPVFGEPRAEEPAWWERELRRLGMPPELLWKSKASSRDPNSTATWDHRKFMSYTPAQWRRAVVRRLSLIYRLPQSDSRLSRMAEYFCLPRGLGRWRFDPELDSLMRLYHSDGTIQRRVNILRLFARFQTSRKLRRQFEAKPVRLNLGRNCVLCFPSAIGRQGRKVKRIDGILDQIGNLYRLAAERPHPKRWRAAAVYLGREFLERPKRLAMVELTQEQVAREFGVTRRQLTYALQLAKNPTCRSGHEDGSSDIARP